MLKRFLPAADGLAADHGRPAASWRVRLQAGRPTRLFGLDLVNAAQDEMAQELVAMAQAGECATIQFVNAHCANVASRHPGYRAALAQADMLLPDGSGIRIAARLADEPTGDNLNGTDLLPLLCRHAAARRQSIFFLGGQPGIAAGAARNMVGRNPGLAVAGTQHGYFDRADEDALIARINASGAAILLVGFGVPLQEMWIQRHRHRLNARIVLGVGGLFDYYSGAIRRAPLPVRKLGCEWAWRLMLEPRRLFTRYVLGNPQFLIAAARPAWQRRDGAGTAFRTVKHASDRLSAAAALLMLAPLFGAVALAIKAEDGGPIFFCQTRIGDRGRPFLM